MYQEGLLQESVILNRRYKKIKNEENNIRIIKPRKGTLTK